MVWNSRIVDFYVIALNKLYNLCSWQDVGLCATRRWVVLLNIYRRLISDGFPAFDAFGRVGTKVARMLIILAVDTLRYITTFVGFLHFKLVM